MEPVEDPLSSHDPTPHSPINDEITSPERKDQEDEGKGEQIDDVTRKHSEEKNEMSPRTNDNRTTEESLGVTPADLLDKNEVPRLNKNDLPTKNQNTSDITGVIKENDSLHLVEEEQTEEREQTTEQSVIEKNLPQLETTPTAPPCPRMWPECTKQNLDNATGNVARELSEFSLELFKAIKSTKPNIVVSPISIALALSQLMLGTGGKTKEELLKTLYNSVSEPQCVHDAIQKLTKHDSLLTANEIFYNKDLSLYNEFMEQSSIFYGSKGIPLPKDKEESLKIINSWVSRKTNNLIPDLMQNLSPDLQLMLINVIYYQGKWMSRFNPELTKQEKFHSNSHKVLVKMMNAHKYPLQNMKDSYLDAQVARFPLSDNCSFVIFMPKSNKAQALKTMEGKLTGEIMTHLMTQLEQKHPQPTSVSIPQLKLDSDLDLNEVISLLGLFGLFENPDLCALANGTELAITDVHHRAVLEIKEEGVKAAAATSITAARTVSVFDVRRPFLFILANDVSKVPIFIGRITDPSKQ